ncbi:hypothetical protein [Rhodoferax sp.]|uniref:hypothetical protein n=1 Tax=Rhodoferax sp. TaxID=50421 RepID=UPI002845CED2|nr:hypothetical protein [Rhodoferax sp.]MDR3370729.1 hypothetical protein [Rhodoferax sp.]
MTALYAALAALGYLWAFWYLYVLVMAFYRASLAGRLTGVAKWLAYPVVLVAIAVDLIANWTIATVWFWQWPTVAWGRPDLVTSRLSRYIAGPDGWRKDQATWLCHNLLDYFDPSGLHCKN